jgi:Spy/CpxP family protein refolding chaperone
MRNSRLILPAVVLSLVPHLLQSQPPTVSPERQAAIVAATRSVNDPVAFVLKHRQELALTDLQIASLAALSAALRDSSAARTALRMRQAQANIALPGLASAMEWGGPVDEQAIRDAARQQSALQAEFLIATARDRRAVGVLLTPEQRAQLPEIESAEIAKAVRGGTR